MTSPPLGADGDGLIRPRDEVQVAALIRFAAAEGRTLRVLGAGHAPPGSVAVDGPQDLVISLDHIAEIEVLDPGARLIRVGAGIHLGRDPSAWGPLSELCDSLLYRLADEHGWTLSSTGGITGQTLGGFLATASAGGSLQHSTLDHVVELRLVDGRGETRTFSDADDGGTPGLAAALPSLGLLGVITSVTLRCDPLFTIAGQEAIVDADHAPIDFRHAGDGRPSLARFLTEVEYARVEWWPQRGAERFLVWQAQGAAPQLGFRATPYEEFTAYPALAEAFISTLYVIFGNLGEPDRARALLARNVDYFDQAIDRLCAAGRVPAGRRRLIDLVRVVLRIAVRAAPMLSRRHALLERMLPRLVPTLLDIVLPLDVHKRGMRAGEPQSFRDWSWHGLPMDDQASDVLLRTAFNEMWVPIGRAGELFTLVQDHFAEPTSVLESYGRTGLYAYELYGAPASGGWLHPGHSDGVDEWRDGSLRLDVYWFSDNAEDPHTRFFPQFWELLRDHEIPFRLHWGKEQPASSPADRGWVDLLASRYPRWYEFLALRSELDPDDVFLTDYWRDRLGLWS